MRAKLIAAICVALTATVVVLACYVSSPDPASPSAAAKPLPQPQRSSDCDPVLKSNGPGALPESSPFEEADREYAAAHSKSGDVSSSTLSATAISEVPLPLAFREPPAAMGLDVQQLNTIQTLRQQFVEAVGGAGQDPKDPEYLARWEAAQPELDQRLQALLGADVYFQFERDANEENIRLSMGRN